MIKKYFALAVSFYFCLTAAFAAAPRLAVIISINGLKNYELESYSGVLSKDGIKRIISSGLYSPNASCKYMPTDATADYASIMTGSTPRYHGIVSDRFYSLLDENIVSSIEDARYDGIHTSKTVSPRLLQATTIADQIKLTNPESKVFSIGLTAESAIMMGGHLADGAVWFDDNSGKICTTTFYDRGMPHWAENENRNFSIDTLCTKHWRPKFALGRYQYPPEGNYFAELLDPTFLKFRESDSICDRMKKFRQSPLINDLIKEMAIRAIRDEQMGTDNAPDLLCVEFNLNSPYSHNMLCAETEDMLVRLDENIKSIIDVIEIAVGLNNSVIVLTAPHQNTSSLEQLENKKLNTGKFNAHRSMALLNAYLMAIYGQGRWITGYYDKNINLNKSLIEDKRIRLNEIEEYVAQFMMEFTGVQTAIPAYQLQIVAGNNNDLPSRLRNSHYKNRSGDVVFTLLPGWAEYDEKTERLLLPTLTQSLCPIAIWSEGRTADDVDISLEEICPTLCHLLRIPFPNACIESPILFK